MKLRIQGDSVRLRLTQKEVEELDQSGAVWSSVVFGPEQVLRYGLATAEDSEGMSVQYNGGLLAVNLPSQLVRKWAQSNEVGMYQADGPVKVTIEKDFECLHRREKEAGLYPNPEAEITH